MKLLLICMLVLCSVSFASAQDSLNVRKVAELAVPQGSQPVGLTVSGNFVYMAALDSGLRIIDVSNPLAPTEVGAFRSWWPAVSSVVVQNLVYMASWSDGLRIVDVSNPSAPTLVGFYQPLDDVYGVAVSGYHAYLGTLHGLRVINVLDPTRPVEVGFCDAADGSWGVVLSGNYAYVGSASQQFFTINILNFATPTLAGVCPVPYDARRVALSGNYAYVADEYGGLRVIDVADPLAPTEIAYFAPQSDAWDVAVSGDYAYIADNWNGLRVINIADPTAPSEVGYYFTRESAKAVAVLGDYVCMADESILGIYDCSAAVSAADPVILHPSAFTLSAYPNPFNPSTTLRFDLPREVKARLVVYDLLGREVNVLKNGVMTSGSHEVPFDASGLSSGTYFVRLESAPFNAVQKMMLIR